MELLSECCRLVHLTNRNQTIPETVIRNYIVQIKQAHHLSSADKASLTIDPRAPSMDSKLQYLEMGPTWVKPMKVDRIRSPDPSCCLPSWYDLTKYIFSKPSVSSTPFSLPTHLKAESSSFFFLFRSILAGLILSSFRPCAEVNQLCYIKYNKVAIAQRVGVTGAVSEDHFFLLNSFA